MRFRVAALIVATLICGCAGPGTQSSPPVQQSAAANASIDMTLVVPFASSASTQRGARYVSASALGLKAIVTDIPPAGATASFTPITSVYALTPGPNPNFIVVPTPASATGHSADLTFVAYNQAPVAGQIPGGAKAVGYALATGFVIVPGQNTINVVLAAVADNFPAPAAENGSFGMMSANPPTLIGMQTSLGLGGNLVPSGTPTLDDAGGNDISAAAGGPWNVVGAVPNVATSAASGVGVTIAETAGSCGAVGSAPHLKLSYNGGAPVTSAAIVKTTDTIAAVYDGGGGAGWFATISAKAQSQTLTYSLSSLAVTAVPNGNASDWNCASQTLSFSAANETALVTIVQHNPATPYTLTIPNAANCTQLVNVYSGNSTLPANLIPEDGLPHSLGVNSTFTIQLITNPPAAAQCAIEVQDVNAGSTGGAAYPGATTYVGALLPPNSVLIQ